MRIVVVVVGVLVLALASRTAVADDRKGTDLERARAHFKRGEAFYDAGNYEHAISEYQAAYALVLRPSLLFNLGQAFRRKAEVSHSADDKRQAVDYYRQYLDADPNGKGASDARGYIAALEKEIGPVPKAVAPAAPAAPAEAPPPAATPPAPASQPPAAVPAPVTAPIRAGDDGATWRIGGIVTAGAGVALVATSVVFALKAKSASDELSDPHGQWDQSLYDSGRASSRNAIVFGSLGAAAIAGGAVMVFILGKSSVPEVTVVPHGATVGAKTRF